VRGVGHVSTQNPDGVKTVSPTLRLALLAVICFSLATLLQPRAMTWGNQTQGGGVLKILFGEGRRLFANHFFIQADVSFHSGYYPSIFDQAKRPKASPMVSGHDEHEGHDRDAKAHSPDGHDSHQPAGEAQSHDEAAHEREMAFLHEPKDWIERFGRHFIITEHTHLAGGKEREILPWLRLSAELDPQRVDTYTVAAYWLRVRLGNAKAAEEFLREGLRNNPNSCEILFELGRVYYEANHDTSRARNVWDLALRKWKEQESPKKDPDLFLLAKITENLAHLEEQEGNVNRAISMLELAKQASPHSEDLQKQIEELKDRLASPPPPK
jgi:tetratricopeptide (TPR) repeat protein